MKNRKEKYSEGQHLRLTLDDIDSFEAFKSHSDEEKEELISLIYVLSEALYHLYAKENEDE